MFRFFTGKYYSTQMRVQSIAVMAFVRKAPKRYAEMPAGAKIMVEFRASAIAALFEARFKQCTHRPGIAIVISPSITI